jgi:D-alanyl-D-alanine carboxypeptidase/D-alanyl-D-alanine-endopeptidase (penicillin-binding protein 4)
MVASPGERIVIINLQPTMQLTRGMFIKRMCTHSVAFYLICISLFITSCSLQKKIGKTAAVALADSSLLNAHVGISIYEPATGKYWYNYNAEKYFVPASNTKLPTCYAAMKYLGDSLVAGRLELDEDTILVIHPSADPTFLHPDFRQQNLYRELRNYDHVRVGIDFSGFDEYPLGSGWSWNDYQEDYMAERSPFPIYGNLVRFDFKGGALASIPGVDILSYDSIVKKDSSKGVNHFQIRRNLSSNTFVVIPTVGPYVPEDVPFRAEDIFVKQALGDTLKLSHGTAVRYSGRGNQLRGKVIHSQPTDSLLKIMMHRSDNFFAEQSLLMVSNERLGVMNDSKIIDTLLKTDLKNLPQPPRWVDGSGLSRYNLFSPKDFVYILNKMKDEFGMDRLKVILPTGGRGTLSSYFLASKDRIFAKTGTLSGVVALSGFYYTRSNKLLIFSVLVNNHHGSATAIRRTVEKFLQNVCNK